MGMRAPIQQYLSMAKDSCDRARGHLPVDATNIIVSTYSFDQMERIIIAASEAYRLSVLTTTLKAHDIPALVRRVRKLRSQILYEMEFVPDITEGTPLEIELKGAFAMQYMRLAIDEPEQR